MNESAPSHTTFMGRLPGSRWCFLYMLPAGFAIFPVAHFAYNGDIPLLVAAVFIGGMLIAIRVSAMVLRRVLPFSAETKEAWLKKRVLAKRYDSFQWQKLFWFGLGLSLYLVFRDSKQQRDEVIISAAFCLSAGAAGMLFWRRNMRADRVSLDENIL
jgi:hypothetical protein